MRWWKVASKLLGGRLAQGSVAGKPSGEKRLVAVAYWWIATWILMLAWFCCFVMCFFFWEVGSFHFMDMAIKFAWSMNVNESLQRQGFGEWLRMRLAKHPCWLWWKLPGNPCAARNYFFCDDMHVSTLLMMWVCNVAGHMFDANHFADHRTWQHVILDVRCHGRWHWEGYIIAHPSSSPDSKVLMFFVVLIVYWLIVLAENNRYVQNI